VERVEDLDRRSQAPSAGLRAREHAGGLRMSRRVALRVGRDRAQDRGRAARRTAFERAEGGGQGRWLVSFASVGSIVSRKRARRRRAPERLGDHLTRRRLRVLGQRARRAPDQPRAPLRRLEHRRDRRLVRGRERRREHAPHAVAIERRQRGALRPLGHQRLRERFVGPDHQERAAPRERDRARRFDQRRPRVLVQAIGVVEHDRRLDADRRHRAATRGLLRRGDPEQRRERREAVVSGRAVEIDDLRAARHARVDEGARHARAPRARRRPHHDHAPFREPRRPHGRRARRRVHATRAERAQRGARRRGAVRGIHLRARLDQRSEARATRERRAASRTQGEAEREQVRGRRHRRAAQQLGREEAVRPAARGRADGGHQPEIDQPHRPRRLDQHVLRLHVAVHDPRLVHPAQHTQQRDRDPLGVVGAPGEVGVERRPFDVLQHRDRLVVVARRGEHPPERRAREP
jgi:hypothetical protein